MKASWRKAIPDYAWQPPGDEWDAISLNYTSGTTGDPKGVVYHHRGAYLNAVSNILNWGMPHHAVYLWTLPMFHCNGWCFPWTVAERAGVNVCLRRVEAKAALDAIRDQRRDAYVRRADRLFHADQRAGGAARRASRIASPARSPAPRRRPRSSKGRRRSASN